MWDDGGYAGHLIDWARKRQVVGQRPAGISRTAESVRPRRTSPGRDAVRAAGVAEEHIYVDKRTGANMDREGLTALLGFARPGDRINVLTPDRLGRDMRETLNLVHDLIERGIFLRTLGDKLAVDTSGTSCSCTGWGSRSSRLPGGQSSGARSASSPLPQGKQGSPGFSRESTSRLRIGVVAGQCLPAPLEVDGFFSDVGGGDGLVVLGGDAPVCAGLRDARLRRNFGAHSLFGPDVVHAPAHEMPAQVGRADGLAAAAEQSLLCAVGGQLLVAGLALLLVLVLHPREVVAVGSSKVASPGRRLSRLVDGSIHAGAARLLRRLRWSTDRARLRLLRLRERPVGLLLDRIGGVLGVGFAQAGLALLEARDKALQVLSRDGLAAITRDGVPPVHVCREGGSLGIGAPLLLVAAPGAVEVVVPRLIGRLRFLNGGGLHGGNRIALLEDLEQRLQLLLGERFPAPGGDSVLVTQPERPLRGGRFDLELRDELLVGPREPLGDVLTRIFRTR
ncbi:recombinase family protein [Streptomyces avermitilis]